MQTWSITCTACGNESPRDRLGFQCVCGGPLDVIFQPSITPDDLEGVNTIWRYRSSIPIGDEDCIVSLGEGLTPVAEEVIGEDWVFLKLEYLAPTGSFKDRGASVLLSRLKEMGIEEILEDSSGNAGCSLAAYAAAAGIRCRVLVPENVPEGKALQIASYGAILERVPGSRDDVAREALRQSETTFYASHNWQPFFIQGTKTFAYEVAEQLSPLPDAIFYPVGNGSLLIGSYKGFMEMQAMGWIDAMPRLIGVQAASHPPIYEELTGRKPSTSAEKTIAGGIAIGRPSRLKQVAEVIRATGGTAVVVEDEQIRNAQRDLARRGYLVEPTAAAALAGYRVWRQTEENEGRDVLIPLTGSGLKDLDSLRSII
jgi:threonine synthase